jgi:hypothetical protein
MARQHSLSSASAAACDESSSILRPFNYAARVTSPRKSSGSDRGGRIPPERVSSSGAEVVGYPSSSGATPRPAPSPRSLRSIRGRIFNDALETPLSARSSGAGGAFGATRRAGPSAAAEPLRADPRALTCGAHMSVVPSPTERPVTQPWRKGTRALHASTDQSVSPRPCRPYTSAVPPASIDRTRTSRPRRAYTTAVPPFTDRPVSPRPRGTYTAKAPSSIDSTATPRPRRAYTTAAVPPFTDRPVSPRPLGKYTATAPSSVDSAATPRPRRAYATEVPSSTDRPVSPRPRGMYTATAPLSVDSRVTPQPRRAYATAVPPSTDRQEPMRQRRAYTLAMPSSAVHPPASLPRQPSPSRLPRWRDDVSASPAPCSRAAHGVPLHLLPPSFFTAPHVDLAGSFGRAAR